MENLYGDNLETKVRFPRLKANSFGDPAGSILLIFYLNLVELERSNAQENTEAQVEAEKLTRIICIE